MLAQTDPTGFSSLLNYQVDTLLAASLFLMVILGILLVRAAQRWINNMDQVFARRDEINSKLLALVEEAGKSNRENAASTTRTATATEVTAQRVIQLDATMSRWQSIQNRSVLPALKSMYERLIRVEKKLDRCNPDELHRELAALRRDISTAAWLVSQHTSNEDITPFSPVKEENPHDS